MAEVKYLVTVDEETGETLKVELVGDSGELTEVDLGEALRMRPAAAPTYAVNIFMGGGHPSVTIDEGGDPGQSFGIPHQPHQPHFGSGRWIPHFRSPHRRREDECDDGEENGEQDDD